MRKRLSNRANKARDVAAPIGVAVMRSFVGGAVTVECQNSQQSKGRSEGKDKKNGSDGRLSSSSNPLVNAMRYRDGCKEKT